MYINNYFYAHGTTLKEDYVELLEDRSKYFYLQYLKMFKQEFASITITGKTAFLYAAGVTTSQGENRVYVGEYSNSQEYDKSGLVIKETTAYIMHKYISTLTKNGIEITYANINSNSCASSMYSIYEAQGLLDRGIVDNVIIVSEDRVATNTIRIFNEHNIEVTPGDGFACIVLTNKEETLQITDAKWEYSYHQNPFYVSADGYMKVKTDAVHIKGHTTGTVQNTEAENILGDTIIGYKNKIGHTQGVSALLELCMVLDDTELDNTILCTASGLGGFYGSCVVHK